MTQKLSFIFLFIATSNLMASDLPKWAEDAFQQSREITPPEDAKIWTLYDETTISLRRNGKWEKKRRIVHRTLERVGVSNAGRYFINGHEDSTKIKKLKGWHRNKIGEVERLDRDNITTVGRSTWRDINLGTLTKASFEDIGMNSVVAFESREIITNYFSLEPILLMSENPTLKRVIIIDDKDRGEAILRPFNLETWGLHGERQGNQYSLQQVPALEHEHITSKSLLIYPFLQVGFFSEGESEPLASWDNKAKWYVRLFHEKALPGMTDVGQPANSLADIQQAADFIKNNITYRQVYLSEARGYEPLSGQVVQNAAYGDCKDMVSCLSYQLVQKQIKVLPTLANISNDLRPGPETTAGPFFNHLISAIPLTKSFGLASEISVDGQIYLIYDPTDRYTPLGKLGSQYWGRRIMICTETGAKWVEIPESALEKDAISIKMLGQVDANYSFSGMLDIRVEGDAGNLRTILLQGNDRDFTWQLRKRLRIPGHVDVLGQRPKVDANGTVTAQYQIFWPSFLMRDVGGLRLPFGLTGNYLMNLNGNNDRQRPIAFDRSAPTFWDITLATPHPLKVANHEWHFDDPHSEVRWKVEEGDTIHIEFSKHIKGGFFNLERLKEGLQWWETYRKEYRDFLAGVAIFYPES